MTEEKVTYAMQKGEERRQYPRNQLKLEVKGGAAVEEPSDSPLEFQGYTKDVSIRGLRIEADRNPGISIGQQLKMMVQLFQDEPSVVMLGQLCWVREDDQGRPEQSTEIGFELLGVLDGPRAYERWIERISWT